MLISPQYSYVLKLWNDDVKSNTHMNVLTTAAAAGLPGGDAAARENIPVLSKHGRVRKHDGSHRQDGWTEKEVRALLHF